MAKICILVTAQPWWDQRHFYKQAPALAEDGHKVVFMAGDPGNKVTDLFEFYPLTVRQRKRARFTGGLNLFLRLLRLRPDILQVCSIELLPLGLLLKLLTRIKVVYDCREDMYESMLSSKVWLPAWFRRILAFCTLVLESLAMRIFDGLIASDPAILEIHKAMPKNRKMIFYNVPLLSQFQKNYLPLDSRPYDIVLLGGMSQRSGILVLIEAMKILSKSCRKIKTLLIGQVDHTDEPVFKKMLEETGWQNDVTITGVVPYKDVPGILTQAKIGLVLLLDLPKFHKNIACKAFEYMACGMPVISSDLPPERLFLKELETAFFIKPGDPTGLAKAIEFLLDNMPMAISMGRNGRKEMELQWNAEKNQQELKRFYKDITGMRTRVWFRR